jgi:hypothetical protein
MASSSPTPIPKSRRRTTLESRGRVVLEVVELIGRFVGLIDRVGALGVLELSGEVVVVVVLVATRGRVIALLWVIIALWFPLWFPAPALTGAVAVVVGEGRRLGKRSRTLDAPPELEFIALFTIGVVVVAVVVVVVVVVVVGGSALGSEKYSVETAG